MTLSPAPRWRWTTPGSTPGSGPPRWPCSAACCPARSPKSPACRYVPAQTAAEIGGDWFDVIPLPAGRCALTVGDVTGHDISAASLMGQLRTATRTLATLDLAPADLLTRLDQITADLTDAETSATCIYAACDPGAANCDIARAGHPPPALARPGHRTAFPRLPAGLPLGTGLPGARYRATRLHLPPGTTLLLYTDGLIEDPAADISSGMARLARTLATTSQLPVSQACDTLLVTLAPNPADDIAILMARTRPRTRRHRQHACISSNGLAAGQAEAQEEQNRLICASESGAPNRLARVFGARHRTARPRPFTVRDRALNLGCARSAADRRGQAAGDSACLAGTERTDLSAISPAFECFAMRR